MQPFLDFLSEISLKEIKVPEHLKIPNWPRIAGKISADLGYRDYYYAIRSDETGLLRIVWNRLKKQKIIFTVEESGTFHVDFIGSRSSFSAGTKDRVLMERICALLVFHQFKDEICKMIIQKLEADLPNHDRLAKTIQEALSPFATT